MNLDKIRNRSLLSSFPSFAKPSYETILHKKVLGDYNIGVAIPYGKRCFLWFTHDGNKNICCIIEVGRNQLLQDNIHYLDWIYPKCFSLGTLLSGYLVEIEEVPNKKYFLADDLFLFQGYQFGNPFPKIFEKKATAFQDFFLQLPSLTNGSFSFHSVVFWTITKEQEEIFELPTYWKTKIGYAVKNIQFSSSKQIVPHGNWPLSRKPWSIGSMGPVLEDEEPLSLSKPSIWKNTNLYEASKMIPNWILDTKKPCYKQNVSFG